MPVDLAAHKSLSLIAFIWCCIFGPLFLLYTFIAARAKKGEFNFLGALMDFTIGHQRRKYTYIHLYSRSKYKAAAFLSRTKTHSAGLEFLIDS